MGLVDGVCHVSQPRFRSDLMSLVRTCCPAFMIAWVLVAGTAFASPSIVGDMVDIWTHAQSNDVEYFQGSFQVVDPGIEYTSTILVTDIYTVNIGPTSIVLNTLDEWYSPWFNSGFEPSRLEFRDIDVPGKPWLSIGGASMIFSDTIMPEAGAPVGYPAFSADNLSFTADSVALETGPYRFPVGSRVQIDLTFVPEPGTATLFCGALFAGALLRRRRSGR
jgi:hypothetical protein